MTPTNMKYCADNYEIWCRKILNMVQGNLKYSAEQYEISCRKILKMVQKNIKLEHMNYCADKY